MSESNRLLKTSYGSIGEELIDFPDTYIQPSRDHKRRIQSGYLDLLYYEYRADGAIRIDGWGQLAILLAVLICAARTYIEVVAVVLAIVGVVILVGNWGTAKKFRSFRGDVEAELLRLGVGVQDQQLTDNTVSSTAWGELHEYSVSHLGIVRPVSTKGFPEDLLYVFDVLEDKVYRN